MKESFPNQQLLIVALLGLFWSGLFLLNPLPGLHSQVQDILLTSSQPSEDITLVKVDDESLNGIGQWPWPRERFAEFIDSVQAASAVGIDVSFNEPSRYGSEDDDALSDAFASSSVPVVLPAKITNTSLALPHEPFRQHVNVGFTNTLIDSDGAVRRAFYKQQDTSSFNYELLQRYASTSLQAQSEVDDSLPPETTQPFRIQFSGPAGTYPMVSFSDVVNGNVSDRLIRDKILIVGVTASSLTSYFNTPFGLMSGLEIHANILNTLVDGDFYSTSQWMNILLVLLFSVIGSVAALNSRRMSVLLASVFGAVVVYIGVAALLAEFQILVDLLYPSVAVIVSTLVTTAYQYVVVARREGVIRESYNTLNTLLESMTEGVVMLSHRQEVVASNPVARGAIQDTDTEISFNTLSDTFSDDFNLKEIFETVITSKEKESFRDIKLGDTYYQVIIAPISPEGTEALNQTGVVLILHDMTEEKEIQRIREDFTSMMVHELRSPLDAVRKMADFLNDHDEVDEEKKEKYLSLMSANSSQVLTLVNDLLDVSKIEAGKFQLNKEPTDISQLAEDQVDFYEQLAEDRNLSFSVEEDVPSEVSFDPDRIKQVMNNLLSNAIKFTDEQEGEVTVQVRYYESDMSEVASEIADVYWFADEEDKQAFANQPFVTIEIRDNGAGMSEDNITELFDKFKQFEAAAKSEKAGTGLGMAIVKGITEEHGGHIGVASKREEGTHFFIALPVNQQGE